MNTAKIKPRLEAQWEHEPIEHKGRWRNYYMPNNEPFFSGKVSFPSAEICKSEAEKNIAEYVTIPGPFMFTDETIIRHTDNWLNCLVIQIPVLE